MFWYELGILDTQDALYLYLSVGLNFNLERLFFFPVKYLYKLYY